MKMKKLIILAIAAALISNLSAAPIKGIDDAATVGVYIKDLRNGNIVAEHQSAAAMTPASVMKCLTTATAMKILGPEYRFETPVYLVGTQRGSTLNGRVVIEASGDPTVDSRYFADRVGFTDSIIALLSRNGIKQLRGDIVVDQTRFSDVGPSPRWEIGDVAWDYGAAFYGFNFADNLVAVDLTTLETEPRLVKFDVKRGDKSGSFDLVRGVGSTTLRVDGKIGKRKSVDTTVPDPVALFKVKMMSALRDAGVTYELLATAGGDTIDVYRHQSPSVAEISRSLMHRSDNMMADAMLRAVSEKKSLAAAVATELKLWDSLEVKLSPVKIHDGSGLVRVDAITPRALGELLSAMAGDTAYVSAFPLVGFDGTVRNFLRDTPLEGKMALKSGSMTAVRCYAGYKLDGDGKPTHAVVIMVNHSFLKPAELRKSLQAYLLSIFD